MLESLTNFFAQFPPELATLLIAMTPIGELRAALPIGIAVYHLPIWQVFVLSVVGNMIPATIILLFAPAFHKYLEKSQGRLHKLWSKYLARAQKKFAHDYAKWGLIGLAIFVGIPLPMTGAWTGAVAAFVFGLPFKKAWWAIFLGVVGAGIIVTVMTVGIGAVL
ncbi:MAG: small multi-drug export protein [Candidatus Magasanikiibacteriota bacterium]